MTARSDLEREYQNDEIHDRWVSVYRKGRFQQAFNDAVMTRLAGWLDVPPDGRILDAGCGTGVHTLRFARLGYHCVGVDLSENVLEVARAAAEAEGFTSNVSFVRGGLEDLSPFRDGEFDAVHCRGVLMHIPRWEDALAELCRVLKPGGRLMIVEGNDRSVELGLVRGIRRFRSGGTELVKTDGGYEFRNKAEGYAPVTRVANQRYLAEQLQRHGVERVARFATEFWDINRFPGGIARTAAVLFNRGWFSLRLPSFLSSGVAYIGQKRQGGAPSTDAAETTAVSAGS